MTNSAVNADQTEAPVIATQHAHPGVTMHKGRPPQQGAIGENPDRLPWRALRQDGLQRGLALGISQPTQAEAIRFSDFGPVVTHSDGVESGVMDGSVTNLSP